MSQPSILIVDDEPELREAIAFDFRRKKFNVLTAAGGREALQLLATQKIDVVLSDVCMPDGGGVDLLDSIKARDPFLPVVILITGFANITLQEAYDRGADAVFAKPFDRKLLIEAVQRALLPPDKAPGRKQSRVPVDIPIGIKFRKSGTKVQARIFNLGRGGLFIAVDSPVPELDDEIDFEFGARTQYTMVLHGSGRVRWVREKSQGALPVGCGVEFTSLSPESAKKLVEIINFEKTKSFIPTN